MDSYPKETFPALVLVLRRKNPKGFMDRAIEYSTDKSTRFEKPQQ
jgi:hypothetical protein